MERVPPSPTTFVAYAHNSSTGYPTNINKDPNSSVSLKKTFSSNFINEVAALLPNGYPVPNYHPSWLKDTDLHIVEDNVHLKVTFVSEGAGYKNSFGYFIYNRSSPPASLDEVAQVIIVMPNASANGSGGSFRTGDTLPIASQGTVSNGIFTPTNYTFSAGQSIGWLLIANGWNGSSISTSQPKYFSKSALNPETVASKKHHTVAVIPSTMSNVVLFGFEDLNRVTGSDNDFNDLVFLIEADPFSGISEDSYSIPSTLSTQGTLILNDNLDFESDRNDCDFNDLVSTYHVDINRSDDTMVRSLNFVFHMTHRGSYNDHSLYLQISGLNGLASYNPIVKQQVFTVNNTVSSDVYTFSAEEVAAIFDGETNPDNLLKISNSTKRLLPANRHNNQLCNTKGEWNTVRNKVDPASVRIKITFGTLVPLSVFNDIDNFVVPLVKVWNSGSFGVDEENTHWVSIGTTVNAPPMLRSSEVNTMNPIYLLKNELNFRPMQEKEAIHRGYLRFVHHVRSNKVDYPVWWNSEKHSPKLTDSIVEPVRVWGSL